MMQHAVGYHPRAVMPRLSPPMTIHPKPFFKCDIELGSDVFNGERLEYN
jgi:hypothetical protein